VLDGLNSFNVNNEDRVMTRTQISHGYVGFRKRFFDDLRQTYIQTQSDLVERGNLWAQYIRKVVQNIRFTSIVTKPLEHYNNFRIKGLESVHEELNLDGLSSRHRGTFPSVWNEFHNFLYSQVVYNIDKSNNIITAEIQGSVVPKFGQLATFADEVPNQQDEQG
jgi:hypothetical protein